MSIIDKWYNRAFRFLQQTGWDTLYLFIKGRRWCRAKRYIQRFVGENVSPKQIRKYRRRLCYAYIRYGWNFDEYFMQIKTLPEYRESFVVFTKFVYTDTANESIIANRLYFVKNPATADVSTACLTGCNASMGSMFKTNNNA